ncbi:hypothetical protein FBU59_002006 [Linderina macrospora]|uniref:Uncharacterized protein n=1 Tax=Linderina macrospora TaxID=4868 RepID=A0ACC1JCF8_9FUNG|nr:hypothetical protein FBU59_002006 [Linderina macrospora]
MHVRPLNDARRPSLDVGHSGFDSYGSAALDGFIDQAAASAYTVNPAQPFNMSALHRRHSLASTGLHMSGRYGRSEAAQFSRAGLENGPLGSMSSDNGGNGSGPQSFMANTSSDLQRYQFFGQAAGMNHGPHMPPMPPQMQGPASVMGGGGGGGGIPFVQHARPNPVANAPLSPLEQQQQQQQQQLLQHQHQHMHQLMIQQQMSSTTQPTPPPPHMRRASHPALNHLAGSYASGGMLAPPSSMPGASGATQHMLMPNPATTITPNMPFADMGKGIAYQSLPKEARTYIVQFKGKRCDLYFTAGANIEVKIFPVATGGSAIPVPASSIPPAAKGASKSAKGNGDVVKPGAKLEPGTCVLVEADRGVDLGVIKEELTTLDEIKKFIGQQAAAIAAAVGSGGIDGHGSEPDHKVQPPLSGSKESRVSAIPVPSSSAGVQPVSVKDIYIKRIFREADQREIADFKDNKALDEQKALAMCQSKVLLRRLSMRVVDAEFQFDRRKLTFYFTADRRVDFRELVRELFKHFKTRIWMCQQTN